MPYFVYILKCKDGSFYTGITWNLKKRVNEHNNHIKTPLQFSKLPANLVYWEKFSDKYLAAKREKEIKGWRRDKKINLIKSLH
jgi:putative endonuclease